MPGVHAILLLTNGTSLRPRWSVRNTVHDGQGMRLLAVPSRHQVPAIDSDSSLSPLPVPGWVAHCAAWPPLILRLTAERSAACAAPPCGAARLHQKKCPTASPRASTTSRDCVPVWPRLVSGSGERYASAPRFVARGSHRPGRLPTKW